MLLVALAMLITAPLAAVQPEAAQGSGDYHLNGPWELLGPADRVSRREDYHTAHIDLASIVRIGGTVFVWAKLESRRSGVDTALVRFEVNCSARATRVRAFQYRDKRRGKIRVLQPEGKHLTPIAEGSFADLVAKRVC